MKVFTYVIVHDSGAAPQHVRPVTLAICKPRIRRSVQPGDLVLAFTGADLGPDPHSVRWAGIVSEKLTFAEYWRDPRFAHKKPAATTAPDNIYRPLDGGYLQIPNSVHDESNVTTDLGGENVLVFEPAWYFGAAGPLLPADFGLRMSARRGHRVTELPDTTAQSLIEWLEANAPEYVQSAPPRGRCPPRSKRVTSGTPPPTPRRARCG